MNYVYVVYVEDSIPSAIPSMGIYSVCAMAFVPDENPDGFALVASHYSSNMDWAKSDIHNDGHQEEIKNVFPDVFPNGFEYVDVNDVPLPTKHRRQDVIDLLKRKQIELEKE